MMNPNYIDDPLGMNLFIHRLFLLQHKCGLHKKFFIEIFMQTFRVNSNLLTFHFNTVVRSDS